MKVARTQLKLESTQMLFTMNWTQNQTSRAWGGKTQLDLAMSIPKSNQCYVRETQYAFTFQWDRFLSFKNSLEDQLYNSLNNIIQFN